MAVKDVPIKAWYALIAAALILVGTVFGFSYKDKLPVTIWDKQFGYGSAELKKKEADLKELTDQNAELLKTLDIVKSDNTKLKEANAELSKKDQERTSQANRIWFPVDDIDFNEDGTFSTKLSKKVGHGKWANKESELTLQLVSIGNGGVVLSTNLPPPGNFIRMSTSSGLLVPLGAWEYLLTITKYSGFGETSVRVERRSRSQT